MNPVARPSSFQPPLALFGGLLGIGLSVWFRVPPEFLLPLTLGWLALLLSVTPMGWSTFFGPVFLFEAIKHGRRTSGFVIRAALAGVIGLFLLLMYRGEFWSQRGDASIADLARFAERFFDTFMVLQAVAVVLITPLLVAPAITEEKERKTLEFLFATDLRGREILFGKLAARLGKMLMYLLAGVPILTLTQFFGGVDPNQVLAYSLGTLMLLIFCASVSIWVSVQVKRSRDALALGFLIILGYHIVSFLLFGLAYQARQEPGWWPNRALSVGGLSVSLVDFMEWTSRGNWIAMNGELQMRVRGGALYGVEIWRVLAGYCEFLLVASGLLLLRAVVRLRPVGLLHTMNDGPRRSRRARRHPPVGDAPVFWREVYVETAFRTGWLSKLVLGLLFLLSLVPFVLMAIDVLWQGDGQLPWRTADWPDRWQRFGRFTNEYVRTMTGVLGGFMLIAAAVRGSAAVRGEHDKQTFDSLIMSRLTVGEILQGKWAGCMLGNRLGIYWLAFLWIVGVASGGIQILVVPVMAVVMGVFLAAFAWLGVYCSIHYSTIQRATTAAVLWGVLLGGGYLLLLALCCILPGFVGDAGVLLRFLLACSPVVVMVYLPMRSLAIDEIYWTDRDGFSWPVLVALGVGGWLYLGLLLRSLATHRFAAENLRSPHEAPEP